MDPRKLVPPPVPSTADGRFTATVCNSSNSVYFNQAPPSQAPGYVSCALGYSSLNSNAQAYTTTTSNTFSLDRSYAGSVFANQLAIDLKYAYTTTTTTEVDRSMSTTQASSATAYIQGLSCNNVQPYLGPCVPVYPGPPQTPTQFMVYQDNSYGTFMFAPVDYY